MDKRARLPSARSQIASFLVMDVMEAARQVELSGDRVLHLEVGQPSTPAPRRVREAAVLAIEEDNLGYSVAAGLPALRQGIAAHYRRRHGVDVDPDTVFVTTGASGAFLLAFLACFDAGDEVAVARPGYPCYRNILSALDLRPVDLPLGAEHEFRFSVDALLCLSRPPRGVVLGSPANPTGTVIGEEALDALLDYCSSHGTVPIVDEIYHGLVYDETPAPSAVGRGEVIVVNSFSKYFSMTGWRLGWMIVPPSLCRTVEALAQNFTICPPALSQRAALAAFDAEEELETHRRRYRENRDVLLAALRRAGVSTLAPADGAFYVYADLSAWTRDSRQLCQEMLSETRVAATPGVDFDPEEGHRFVRFSYCGGQEEIREASLRIEQYLRSKLTG